MLSNLSTMTDMVQLSTTGERLRAAMTKRGYGPAMLARETGLSLTTIYHFLHNRRDMHLDDMQKIGTALQTSPAWITWGQR